MSTTAMTLFWFLRANLWGFAHCRMSAGQVVTRPRAASQEESTDTRQSPETRQSPATRQPPEKRQSPGKWEGGGFEGDLKGELLPVEETLFDRVVCLTHLALRLRARLRKRERAFVCV